MAATWLDSELHMKRTVRWAFFKILHTGPLRSITSTSAFATSGIEKVCVWVFFAPFAIFRLELCSQFGHVGIMGVGGARGVSAWKLGLPETFYPLPPARAASLSGSFLSFFFPFFFFIAGLWFHIRTCLFLYPRQQRGMLLWFVISSAGGGGEGEEEGEGERCHSSSATSRMQLKPPRPPPKKIL